MFIDKLRSSSSDNNFDNQYLLLRKTNIPCIQSLPLNYKIIVLNKYLFILESISPTYYVQLLRRYICAKKVQTLNLSTKKLCAKLSYEKAVHKMLVKLTPGRQNRKCDEGLRLNYRVCQELLPS
jgi:hypothetical protein